MTADVAIGIAAWTAMVLVGLAAIVIGGYADDKAFMFIGSASFVIGTIRLGILIADEYYSAA